MIAEVLIEYNNKNLDKTFDYLVPFNMEKKLKVGHKVVVEFGNTTVEGFVLRIKNDFEEGIKYKKIVNIVDEEFILFNELLRLGLYIKSNTFCNLISAYSCMLPKALKAKHKVNISKKYNTYLLLNKNTDINEYITNNKRNVGEIKILNSFSKEEKILKKNYSLSSANNLIKKGIIIEIKEEENRYKINKTLDKEIVLTEEQNNVYNSIKNDKANNMFLLHGVTGSGKTEVYIKLIKDVLKENKTVIMLVPEISLTPQIVDRFSSVFTDKIAVLHSRLSEGEKYDEYRKILRGEVNIVIGARSAVFAPVKNLGLIIIDEEHSSSYKQESTPKYNAIDIAKERIKYNNCKLILGSATPSLESYARGLKGLYKLLELNNRISVKMPKISLIDMNEEIKKRNFIISSELENKINEKLNKKEQIILLLNRRGYSTFISCTSCGYVHKCPNCDISLTYHKTNNTLRCHYCGYTKIFTNLCPDCKENSMKDVGMGTEKLEKIIKEKFKSAKVLRMDFDTTNTKGSHEKIINSFMNKEYDILLGTQMISKGLNFPGVTLVGIINSDAVLNIPDFRSSERAFQLYSQTSGRSGRNEIQGEVLIQTFNTDNKILNYVKNNDYKSFYNYEMSVRKILKYPPYFYITNIKIISNDYNIASKEANKVLNYLNEKLNEDYIILGPTTASMFKVNNKYHFTILIKYKNDKLLKEVLLNLNNIYKTTKVYIDIDNNPLSMI